MPFVESVGSVVNNFKSGGNANHNQRSRRKILAASNPSMAALDRDMSQGEFQGAAECGKHAEIIKTLQGNVL